MSPAAALLEPTLRSAAPASTNSTKGALVRRFILGPGLGLLRSTCGAIFWCWTPLPNNNREIGERIVYSLIFFLQPLMTQVLNSYGERGMIFMVLRICSTVYTCRERRVRRRWLRFHLSFSFCSFSFFFSLLGLFFFLFFFLSFFGHSFIFGAGGTRNAKG